MYRTGRQTLVMLVAVGVLLGASERVCRAAPPMLRSAMMVTLSDTAQPFYEQDSHALNTLSVTIEDQQWWLFNVTRVETITGTDPGLMLLSELFLPELHIKELTADMAVLADPSVAVKTVTLQGFLSVADRNFYVRDASVAEQTAQETR